jgi:hypothetical protein
MAIIMYLTGQAATIGAEKAPPPGAGVYGNYANWRYCHNGDRGK